MTFKEKIKSMKFSEIMQAMLDGLRKEHVKISMGTFGDTWGNICYGCAATNAICEISGKVFTFNSISSPRVRSEYIDTEFKFLVSFEYAIDKLRKSYIESYNYYAQDNFIKAPVEFLEILNKLPSLDDNFNDINYNDKSNRTYIQQYQDACDQIKAAGY